MENNFFFEAAKMLADFSFKDADMVEIKVIFDCKDRRLVTNTVSTHKTPKIVKWGETEWRGWFISQIKKDKEYGFNPWGVVSIVVAFSFDGSLIYHLEATEFDRKPYFDRLITPPALGGKRTECYFDEMEQRFINSLENAIIAMEIVADKRFKEIDNDLPLCLRPSSEEEDEIGFIEY